MPLLEGWEGTSTPEDHKERERGGGEGIGLSLGALRFSSDRLTLNGFITIHQHRGPTLVKPTFGLQLLVGGAEDLREALVPELRRRKAPSGTP